MDTVYTVHKLYIEPRVSIDDRSLALFRIIMGILIIADVILRFRNLHFFYTDEGPVPAEFIVSEYNLYSIFTVFTDPFSASVIFILQIILAMLLIVGFKTRTVMLLSALLVISVDVRNPFVTSYADVLFRFLLAWAVFLPLQNAWSVDAIQREALTQDWSIVNKVAGFFILFQMLAMYIVNGSFKFASYEEWMSGWAFHTILHYDRITWLLGSYVREAPEWFIQIGSIYWFVLMLIAPLLLVFLGRFRYLLAGALMVGHLNIALTTRVGAFSFVAIGGLCLFLPQKFWSDIAHLKNYYSLDTIRDFAIQVGEEFPSFTVIPQNQTVNKSFIVVVLFCLLLVGFSMGVMTAYNSAYIVSPDEDEDSHSIDIIYEGSSYINNSLSPLRLDQPEWNFYTRSRVTDTHYVFAAETQSGEVIDLFNDTDEVSFDRAYGHDLQKQFRTYRYRFYYSSVERSDSPHGSAASHLAEYHCENWSDNGDSLEYISMYQIVERWDKETIGDIDNYEQVRIELIHAHSCSGETPKLISEPDGLAESSIPDWVERDGDTSEDF